MSQSKAALYEAAFLIPLCHGFHVIWKKHADIVVGDFYKLI